MLSRRGIAEEALRLVEEEGMEALTTRRLAKRLGVEGPSLYNHVANRDDLLDEMTALIDEQVDASLLDHAGLARGHRRVRPLLPARVLRAAAARGHDRQPARAARIALSAYDKAFAAFARWGWDATHRRDGHGRDRLPRARLGDRDLQGRLRPASRTSTPRTYPHLARGAATATAGDDVDDLGFELGPALR